MARLGEIEPRERAGAKTGRRYEYQYERAARRVLDLLDHQKRHVCVYCDWHDDFVVERGDPPTQYVFHQVKGRKSGLGAWTFADFFGVTKHVTRPLPKSAKVAKGAIVPLMLLHYLNFPDTCEGLAFVTNTGFDQKLEDFMNAMAAAAKLDDLGTEDRTSFDFIAVAYLAGRKRLAPSPAVLFDRIRSIRLFPDEPHLDDERIAIAELVDLIEEFSEINLAHVQARKIAKGVVEKVRQKAHFDRTSVPATENTLRHEKGIDVAELLGVLSLSTEGYEALRQGRSAVDVKQLSRIQRYCERIGAQSLMADVCALKGEWEAWRTVERHTMDKLDFMALIQKATDVVAQNYPFERMIDEARTIATGFAGLTNSPLSGSHVLGLMFSIIARSEPRHAGQR